MKHFSCGRKSMSVFSSYTFLSLILVTIYVHRLPINTNLSLPENLSL